MSLDQTVAIFVPLVEGLAKVILHLLSGEVAHHEGQRSLTEFGISSEVLELCDRVHRNLLVELGLDLLLDPLVLDGVLG